MSYKTQISEESSPKEYCTWQEIEVLVEKLAHMIQRSHSKYDVVLAVTNGGIIPARLVALELGLNNIQFALIRNKKLYAEKMFPFLKGRKYLIVDDRYDTGDTFNMIYAMVKDFDCDFAFLMSRYKNSNSSLVAKALNHEK